MEKHPIDSRFKEGLGGLRPQPSADAWARLQSRMAEETAPEVQEEEPQKKTFVMWYSIAAAITLLLLSVGVYRINFMPEQTNQIASATKTNKTENTITSRPEVQKTGKTLANQAVVAHNNQTAGLEGKNETIAQNGKNKTVIMPAVKQEIEAQKSAAVQIASVEKQPSNTRNTLTVPAKIKAETAALVIEKRAPEMAENNTLLAASNSPVKPEDASGNKPGANLPENVIEVVVIKSQPQVVLASNQPEEEPAGRGELLKNIFKQARNLKSGEKVDLEEIGIAPDSRLAMETRNIKQNITEKFTKVLEL